MKKFSKLSIPYLIWMILLVMIPIAILIVMAFQKTNGIKIFEGKLDFNNFMVLATPKVIESLWLSFLYSLVATICCIIIAYPIAYILVLPMWSNTLLRTKAVASLFMEGNIISSMFAKIGLILPTLDLYGKPLGVIIGMVSMYLPFMILPIYTVLEKIDHSLYDASDDLGVNTFQTFWKVTFPISLKGIITGIILVFLPCATGFGIAEGLGESGLIGTFIQQQFGNNLTYGVGALISLVILIIITASLFIVGKVDKEGETLL